MLGKHPDEVYLQIAEESEGSMTASEVYSNLCGSPSLQYAA